MAVTATLSENSGYYLEIYASLSSQDKVKKTSTVYYRVRVYKTGSFGHWGGNGIGSNGSATSSVGGLWSDNDIAYDFLNASVITFKEGYFTVPHKADGSATYSVSASIYLVQLGRASVSTGTRSLPGMARVPPAPSPVTFDQLTTTSVRARFSGQGDGGSPILEWQLGWGFRPGTPSSIVKSNGTTVVPKLQPGMFYWFWARGRNALGWGPWSSVRTVQTLPGARVRSNGVWRNAVVYVKVKGVWKVATPYVRSGGRWKPTG